jgi:ubiquitin-protein ligase E3 A
VLDFKELESATQYVDGYTQDSSIIKWLWEIIHGEFTELQRKQFLQFATGCDRAPVSGLSNLMFNIGRQGPDTDRLPTAHTCFNHLLVPDYNSKDKLRTKLLSAIQNAEGFGLF